MSTEAERWAKNGAFMDKPAPPMNTREEIGLLFDNDVRAVRSVLSDIITDYDVIDELVQQTFLRALEYADRFDEEKSALLTWVCNLSKGIAKNWLRDQRTEPDIILESYLNLGRDEDGAVSYDELYCATNPCDDPASEAEADDLFYAALALMPTQMARCVALRRDGYSNQDIARTVETTEAVVRSQISQSRKYFT